MNIDHDMFMAVLEGNNEEIKKLSELGANINNKNGHLIIAASNLGYVETVKTLIERGADVQTQFNSALREAATRGHTDVVDLLLNNGADVHAVADEAIIKASENGHHKTVKTLLKHGANVHAEFYWPLKAAARNNKQDVVNLLVIDYNMPISQDTMDYLKQMNLQETIDTINKRDLNIKLNSNLKQKKEKSFTMKI